MLMSGLKENSGALLLQTACLEEAKQVFEKISAQAFGKLSSRFDNTTDTVYHSSTNVMGKMFKGRVTGG